MNRNDGRALFSLALLDEYGRESAGDTFMRPQRELTNALTQYENYLSLRYIEQRLFHQVTGEPMKFLTLADWTGVIETELFARTYQSYGLNTIRYRVLEIAATVEPYENNRGHTLRVLRAGKPRERAIPNPEGGRQ